MHILVTAGNTQAPIDRVRCVANIFSGKTGASIALAARQRGHFLTLLTSHPEVVESLRDKNADLSLGWTMLPYRTFDELNHLMRENIVGGRLDAVVHCAAVSDYLVTGVFAPDETTHFDADGRWRSDDRFPTLRDRAAEKVKSDEPELWLRLTRAPKLVDRIRTDWKFAGTLVKFKLEVGLDDARLLEIAEKSRRQSAADFMVANALEGAGQYAFLGPIDGAYLRVDRSSLADRLLDVLEQRSGTGDG